MLDVRTLKMFSGMFLFTALFLFPVIAAVEEDPTTTSTSSPDTGKDVVWSGCVSKCGCDGLYIYDSAEDRCIVNFRKVFKVVEVIYDNGDNSGIEKKGMAKKIYVEGERIFKGILISVFLFITCAGVCIASACIYCCRISYTDRVLKQDVKAVAKKLNQNYSSKKIAPKMPLVSNKAESCQVVVEDAGVFVA